MRYLIVMALVLSSSVSGADLPDETLAVVRHHFGDTISVRTEVTGTAPYLVADLNGDGEDDLVVSIDGDNAMKRLTDKAVTAIGQRTITETVGTGCHGLGIVHSYRREPVRQRAFLTYECYTSFKLVSFTGDIPPSDVPGLAKQPSSMSQPGLILTLKDGSNVGLAWVFTKYEKLTLR
jgi:hypothetical protein